MEKAALARKQRKKAKPPRRSARAAAGSHAAEPDTAVLVAVASTAQIEAAAAAVPNVGPGTDDSSGAAERRPDGASSSLPVQEPAAIGHTDSSWMLCPLTKVISHFIRAKKVT